MKRLLILAVLLVGCMGYAHAGACTRYWVGGGSSANWTATGNTNWGSASDTRDNAAVPGASDVVCFDGSTNGNTASTLSASITILELQVASGYTQTLTHAAASTLTIAGNVFTLDSGMTYTLGNTATSALSFTGAGTTVVTP